MDLQFVQELGVVLTFLAVLVVVQQLTRSDEARMALTRGPRIALITLVVISTLSFLLMTPGYSGT
jgi:uncharacterized membrane protein YkgB